MASRTPRRSVSIRGTSYERLRRTCERLGVSCSGTVEALIFEWCSAQHEPMVLESELPKRPSPAERRETTATENEAAVEAHFTF